MPYVPPGPSGMPEGYTGPYSPGYTPLPQDWGEQDDPMYVEPGAWLGLAEEELVLEKYIADQQDEIDRLKIELGKETNEIERGKLREQIRANKAEMRMRQEELAEKRRVTELGLANSPIDFVAYEMYKRQLKAGGEAQGAEYAGEQAGQQARLERAGQTAQVAEQQYKSKLAALQAQLDKYSKPPYYKPGRPPTEMMEMYKSEIAAHKAQYQTKLGAQAAQMAKLTAWENPEAKGYAPFADPRSDVDIQAMIREMVGAGGGSLGAGAFGVAVPTTQAISRQEGRGYSQDEMAILSSFLRAGFDVNGEEVSYDPSDYWREVQEGWVPTVRTPETTQYAY